MSKAPLSSNGQNGHHQSESNGNGYSSHAKGANGNGHHSRANEANAANSDRMPDKVKKSKGPSPLASIMKLRQLSKRKMPTEMGDGSYRSLEKRPGLRQDIKTIGMAGK